MPGKIVHNGFLNKNNFFQFFSWFRPKHHLKKKLCFNKSAKTGLSKYAFSLLQPFLVPELHHSITAAEFQRVVFVWSDGWKRRFTHVLALDALKFTRKELQYSATSVNRELLKCFCGFRSKLESDKKAAIATGNWGCGVFKGNIELKCKFSRDVLGLYSQLYTKDTEFVCIFFLIYKTWIISVKPILRLFVSHFLNFSKIQFFSKFEINQKLISNNFALWKQ